VSNTTESYSNEHIPINTKSNLWQSKGFEVVHKSFVKYNPYTDSTTSMKFYEVCDHDGLNANEEMLNLSIGQILLESGAQQFYSEGHKKHGELVVSSADAIGITQILPSTALYLMKKKIKKKDVEEFKALGAEDFSFHKIKFNKKKKLHLARIWLEDETNNIIMWGFIMNRKLKVKSHRDALVSYNTGDAGFNRYLRSGGTTNNHPYMRGIMSRLRYIAKVD
jgi:hypothetical protein